MPEEAHFVAKASPIPEFALVFQNLVMEGVVLRGRIDVPEAPPVITARLLAAKTGCEDIVVVEWCLRVEMAG